MNRQTMRQYKLQVNVCKYKLKQKHFITKVFLFSCEHNASMHHLDLQTRFYLKNIENNTQQKMLINKFIDIHDLNDLTLSYFLIFRK
jgi:hypothetical protein